MTTIFAESALLPDGWARDVRLTVDAAGDIAAVARGAAPGDSERCAILVPGLPDLHSHAFQRAMAGLAERAGPAGDDFWTWRELMYRFASRLGPAELEAIAGLLYVELLRHGYTAVCEFHYVHNDPEGTPYEIATTMVDAICAASGASGIGLTLLPVLYQQAGFGGRAPDQARHSSTSRTCSATWIWIGPSGASSTRAFNSRGVTARRLCGATPTTASGIDRTAFRLASRRRAKPSRSLMKRRWPSFGAAPPKPEWA